jgi:hypothetical protein
MLGFYKGTLILSLPSLDGIMVIKFVVVALLLVIIFSLGSAMVYMVKDRGRSTRALKALTFRIGLSLALFALLIIGYYVGIITPDTFVPR